MNLHINYHLRLEHGMKPEDKDKLNQCLEILDTTDLGLSLVWLWTWSTINNILEDASYEAVATKDDMWGHLCEAVEAGQGFSLEYGAEDHHESVIDWMFNHGFILDPEDKEEEAKDEDE